MSLRLGRLAAAIGLSLALASCGGSPTASNSGSGPGDAAAKFQQYESLKGQERRDTLLKDAKTEGEVSLYTSMTSDVAGTVTKAFTEQTGIKVNLYRADSETVLQRILQESSANHAGADVVETDALEMASLGKEQLVQPYTGERRDLVGEQGKFENWNTTCSPLAGTPRRCPRVLSRHRGKAWPIPSGTVRWRWSSTTTTGT